MGPGEGASEEKEGLEEEKKEIDEGKEGAKEES